MALPILNIETEQLPDLESTEQAAPQDQITAPKLPKGARITEGNARLLAFVGMFPGADSESLSVLSNRQETRFAPGGELTSIKGTEQRLNKIERIGALGKYKDPSTKHTHYSLTKQGFAAAWSFGYDLSHGATLAGTSKTRVTHYQMIAHVAAQFASPEGFFRESLGIEPVALDALISEHAMRGAYEKVNQMLKEAKKKGESGDFGRWREDAKIESLKAAHTGKIHWSDTVESKPVLLTMGNPQREGMQLKPVHQPDLAVILDDNRVGLDSKNLIVEIELSKKSWEEYDAILRTLKKELDHPFIYSRAVYFTVGTQVETLLRKVDAAGELDLFKSGKLQVLPILHRDGTPVRFNRRITIGEN